MARPKTTKGGSLYRLGLATEEDIKLQGMLDERGISIRRLLRALARQWMSEGGDGGKLKYK